jgi:hypothetical protein
MHAVAVVFDFVEPLVAFWRFGNQLGQLRRIHLGKAARACRAS